MSAITVNLNVPLQQGLVNHGNTCYINAIVQCLAHCDALANYLVTEEYVTDMAALTPSQQRNAKKHGSDGAITKALAHLLQVVYVAKATSKLFSGTMAQLLPTGDVKALQGYRWQAQHYV